MKEGGKEGRREGGREEKGKDISMRGRRGQKGLLVSFNF